MLDLRRHAAWLRRRLAGRHDSEHEQVLIRCGIALTALGYLALYALTPSASADLAGQCLPLAVSYVAGSFVLLAHLLHDPAPRPARRYVAMTLDMTVLGLALVIGEAAAAVFYPFYLWITLGMGFRYGKHYLYVSAALSLVSFAAVIGTTAYWRSQPALSAGLWLALLVLPAYASSLLTKLTDALSRAEAASRAKSRFLATMSHELRTPLSAIIGMADLLRHSRLEGEQQDMVQTVRSAGRTLLEMIDDVLDVAKIESGKAEVKPVAFDLHELIANVRALLHHAALDKGLTLSISIDPTLPYRLQGPVRPLQQVLLNLIANGIKFTEQGEVRVDFACAATDEDKVQLRVAVEDTGIGIAREAQERIFEQFTQADDSTTRRYGGTGLGLAIARQLTGLMGGTLSVESEAGMGARFVLEVAFRRLPEEPHRLQGCVVVLGEPSLAQPWCRRLADWGASVWPAADLVEAKRALARSEGAHALVMIGGRAARAAQDLLADYALRCPAVPLNLVLVSDGEQPAPRSGFLAVLPVEADDQKLFAVLHAALAKPERPAGDHAPTELAHAPGRRLLLAEDNRINQKVITKILERGGHEVTAVGNGEEALDALERETFDLVLMDLNMPVMSGIDAAKMYRFMNGGGAGPKLVALTADVTEATRAACADAGIVDFVTKPVEAATLLETVARLTVAPPQPSRGARPDRGVVVPHPRLVLQAPALDLAHLDRLRQLDDDDAFLAQLVGDFLDDAAHLVGELQDAARKGDAAAFRDRAHALRSSAAHIGANAMFELCLSWRNLSSAELDLHGASFARRLEVEFDRLRAALMAAVEGTGSGSRPAAGGG